MAQSDIDLGWDFISREQPDAAVASLFGDEEGDPKLAAKSMQLAQDTGTPASVIYADPERFQKNQMARWASDLVRENPHLQSFLTDDGMAAKIAKNDIPNLDIASQAIQKVGAFGNRQLEGLTKDALVTKIAPAMWHGANEGFGSQPMMSWLDSAAPGMWEYNPVAAGAWTLLGYPVEAVFRTINAGVKAVAEGARVTSSEVYHSITGNQSEAERFGRDIGGMFEAELMGMSGRGHTAKPPPLLPEMQTVMGIRGKDFQERMVEAADKRWEFREELAKIKAWVDGGEEPPPGVSEFVDKVRTNQSRAAIKDLSDAYSESQKSETRELSPETYKKFVQQHGDSSIEINGAAIAKLYGDKLPEAEDGILGHLPNIKDDLETALTTGGDVTIPMAEWLTLEPDVAKALKDDVRVRPGLFTANEIKEKGEAKAEPLPDTMPQVRAAAGLEPMFAIGDRKVQLKRAKTEQSYTGDAQFHDFEIVDQDGQAVGSVNISTQKDGKTLYVDMIQAGADKRRYDPNFLGPALIRDLLRQLKAEFPEAETITGHRVSGAREKAGTWEEKHAMPIVPLRAEGAADFRDLLSRIVAAGEDTRQRAEVAPGIEAVFRGPEDWSTHEAEIARAVQDEFRKILPQSTSRVVDEIREPGRDTGGITQAIAIPDLKDPAKDLVVFTLMSPDKLGDVHHEAIHQLRRGFFTDKEWETLREAALTENWHGAHKIDRFYGQLHPDLQIEEAVAEQFRTWMRDREAKVSPEVHGIFERLKAFFETLRKRIGEVLGREFTWEELFQKAAEGEIGAREQGRGTAGLDVMRAVGDEGKPPPLPKQGELDVTRIADKEPFRPGAMTPAMTADMQKRYMDLIAERHKQDEANAQARAERFQRTQQTAEWKRKREEMRVEVEKEINNRPDVAADLFFSRGELYGERIGGRPKIDPESLSPELRERLTATDWVKPGGMDAADAANLFGFRTAEQMFDALSEYQAQRAEGIGAKRQRDMLVERETDRQMELHYGRLEDNIIAEARDQAASETQLQLLHEETMFLATQAKAEFSITREQMRRWAEEQFGKATFADTTSAKWFQTSGKVGRAAEEALLKDKPAEAFAAKQQQYFAMSMAQQALKLEKERSQFEKQVQKFRKREVKGIDREFTDFIQEMLLGSNIPLRVTKEEIQASKLFHGTTNLKDFVNEKLGLFQDTASEISPELQAGMYKDIKTMSVNDFRDLKDAVDALAFAGRRSQKIFAEGRAEEKQAVIDKIVDSLNEHARRHPDKPPGMLAGMEAALLKPEFIIRHMDNLKEMGPAFRYLWKPITDASAHFLKMEQELTKKLESMMTGKKEWQKSLREQLPNDFFFDPYDGTLFNLTRENLVRIMTHMGNESNWSRFVKGWAAYDKPTKEQVADFQGRLEKWVHDNAKPEDWEFVKDMWKVFEDWQEPLDTVHRNTVGKLPKWVSPGEIKLPDGSTIKGGYFPLIPDKSRPIPGTGFDPLPEIKNGVMQRTYYRPSTTKTHMIERQPNAVFRVEFRGDLGDVALRMQQVMHDISYREAIMDVASLLSDKKLRQVIKERVGEHHLSQLDAWLKRQANHLNYDEIALKYWNQFLQRGRQNLVAYALPLNLNVILSPSVAAPNLKTLGLWMETTWNYDKMRDVAMEHSQVVPHTEYNIDRDFREHVEALARKGNWDKMRTDLTKRFYKPTIMLEQRLRTVTFYQEFNNALEANSPGMKAAREKAYDYARLVDKKNEADAVAAGQEAANKYAATIADSKVRTRHGSQTMADLPTLMASNEGYKFLTMFYGYFNTLYNWSREIPTHVKQKNLGEVGTAAWGAIIIPAAIGALMFNKAKEDEPWWKTTAKAFTLGLAQGLPVAREVANYAWEGFKPTTPIATAIAGVGDIGKDIYKLTQSKKADNIIRHGTTVAGSAFGVPGTLQMGKTGQFMYDYARGKQRPKDFWEWWRGIRTGEAKLKKGS